MEKNYLALGGIELGDDGSVVAFRTKLGGYLTFKPDPGKIVLRTRFLTALDGEDYWRQLLLEKVPVPAPNPHPEHPLLSDTNEEMS